MPQSAVTRGLGGQVCGLLHLRPQHRCRAEPAEEVAKVAVGVALHRRDVELDRRWLRRRLQQHHPAGRWLCWRGERER
eukprot:scaffold32195_cov65-Phaeocystis_antarctica.AAC.3